MRTIFSVRMMTADPESTSLYPTSIAAAVSAHMNENIIERVLRDQYYKAFWDT